MLSHQLWKPALFNFKKISSVAYLVSVCRGNSFRKPRPSSLERLPRVPLRVCQGITTPDKKYYLSWVLWLCLGVSSQLKMPETPPQGHIHEAYWPDAQNHFDWLLLIWRSNGTTLSTSQRSMLLTFFEHLLLEPKSLKGQLKVFVYSMTTSISSHLCVLP